MGEESKFEIRNQKFERMDGASRIGGDDNLENARPARQTFRISDPPEDGPVLRHGFDFRISHLLATVIQRIRASRAKHFGFLISIFEFLIHTVWGAHSFRSGLNISASR